MRNCSISLCNFKVSVQNYIMAQTMAARASSWPAVFSTSEKEAAESTLMLKRDLPDFESVVVSFPDAAGAEGVADFGLVDFAAGLGTVTPFLRCSSAYWHEENSSAFNDES